jgi:hypothetical protein
VTGLPLTAGMMIAFRGTGRFRPTGSRKAKERARAERRRTLWLDWIHGPLVTVISSIDFDTRTVTIESHR